MNCACAMLRRLVLLGLLGAMALNAHAGPPTCSFIFHPPYSPLYTRSCWYPMPAYDQSNPNFAAYLTPTTVVSDVANNINTASVTAFQIHNNVVTFTANNGFSSGDTVLVTGLSSAVGQTLTWTELTVASGGLSSTEFSALYEHGNVASTSDSGTAYDTATPAPTPMQGMIVCSAAVCGNPFDSSWLPAGPIPGDAYSFNSWWWTAICCPTAESMALMGAIANKSPSTTISGWTANFYAGGPPTPPSSGLTNQTGPIFPFVPDTRTHMLAADIQRVIDMALAQGTNPSAGGNFDHIQSILGDFTPAATGAIGSANNISNSTFVNDISAGSVIVIAIHTWQAHVASTGSNADAVTFTWVGDGHCLAVTGFISSTFRNPIGGVSVTQSVEVLNPVYGAAEWIDMLNVTNGTYTQSGLSRTLTLPGTGWTTGAIWPDAGSSPVNSVWDIVDGENIVFIDAYETLSVP
ncbi:MAG: hypothetical protein WBV46_14065 [Terriglobales bacterium]|jgi:hypothetical protein